MSRANEQLRTEAARLRQRIEVLEQENRRLSEANDVVKRDVGEVFDCCPKVKKDLTNLEREVAKLKEEIKVMNQKQAQLEIRANQPKADPLAPPAADAAVPPDSPRWKSPSSPPASNVAPLPPKPAPVDVSPPAPPKQAKEFPPLMRKRWFGHDVPDGIIAHLTRECGGNVHDREVVDVTSGSFDKETLRPLDGNDPKNAADLETDSIFLSACRDKKEDIPYTRNNWLCYDFRERRIVPTHYAIRTYEFGPGGWHLKSWLVEISTDGETWREIAREEDNKQLKGSKFSATFAVARGGGCRFIRLVNIGRNHRGSDLLSISAWEIFGSLVE
jgi:hypothetical protein